MTPSSGSPWDDHGLAKAINDYWRKSDFEQEHRAAVARIIQRLGSATVLDVGCGTGLLYAFIAEKNEYCGIDSSTEMLSIARKQHGHAQFVRGDARHLPFREKSFELITCVDMLQHIDNIQPVLSALSEISAEHVLVVTWTHGLPTQRRSVNLSSKEGKLTETIVSAGRFQYIVYNLNELLEIILKANGVSRHQLAIYDLGANSIAIQIKVSALEEREHQDTGQSLI